MSEQDWTQVNTLPRPVNDDKEAWRAYWIEQRQLWRWEPEIDEERQKYLATRRKVIPDFEQGIYPFKDIDPNLSRADVEWLLSMHDNNCGLVDWYDESQCECEGLDLRGVDLRGEYLYGLPLAKYNLSAAHLEKASLNNAHLEGADLIGTFFDAATNLEGLVLSNNKYGTASLVDIHWGM